MPDPNPINVDVFDKAFWDNPAFAPPLNVGNKQKAVIMDDVEQKPQPVPNYKIFWGGADVDPSLYNRPRSDMCGNSHKVTDEVELKQMKKCIENGIPIIGICRGAQLLNVANGGILVQHIDGHAIGKEHSCTEVNTGKVYFVSSTHHQMMVAHQDGHILFKDHNQTKGVHWDDVNEPYKYKYVTEVVYYPKTKSLCIQPHPEWMDQRSEFVQWINRFIEKEWGLSPINFTAEEAAFLRR